MAKRYNWFRADNAVIDTYGRELGAHGLAVYMVLARHVNGQGVCYPSVATIAAAIGASARTVQRQLRRLEVLGLIRPVGDTTGGRGLATTYQLMDAQAAAERASESHPLGNGKGRQADTVSPERVTETAERASGSHPLAEKGDRNDEKGDRESPQQDYRRRSSSSSSSSAASEAKNHSADPEFGAMAAMFMANGFGEMTNLAAEELGALSDEYGVHEVVEAIKQGVRQNKRTLSYVAATLRGRKEDRDDGNTQGRRPRAAGRRVTAGPRTLGKFAGLSTDVE